MNLEQQIAAKEFSLALAFESREVNDKTVESALKVAQEIYDWYIKDLK